MVIWQYCCIDETITNIIVHIIVKKVYSFNVIEKYEVQLKNVIICFGAPGVLVTYVPIQTSNMLFYFR